MKLNQTLLLGAVATLGIVAGVLWGSRHAQTPEPIAAPVSHPAAKLEAAPVAPPTPAVAPDPHRAKPLDQAPQPATVLLAEDVTILHTLVDTPEKLRAVIAVAVKAAGGEQRQRTLLSADWQLAITLQDRAMYVQMQTDREGNILIMDNRLNSEWYLVHDICRARQFGIVRPCSDDEFPHALAAMEMAAVPSRLEKLTPPMGSVGNSFDAVWVQLPSAPRTPKRVSIRRETGDVWSDYGTVTAETEPLRPQRALGVATNWIVSSIVGRPTHDPAQPPPKRDWQATIHVRDVQPRASAALIKLPELTTSQPLSLFSRPAMWVTTPGMPLDKMEDPSFKKLLALEHVDIVLSEQFFPNDAGWTPTTDRKVVIQRPDAATEGLPKDIRIQEIPAEPRVAHKFLTARWDDMPKEFGRFLDEIRHAGYHVGAGAAFGCYFDKVGDNILAEFQVPLTRP